MMRCDGCGGRLADGGAFCPVCGRSVDGDPSQPVAAVEETVATAPAWRTAALSLLAVGAAFAAVGASTRAAAPDTTVPAATSTPTTYLPAPSVLPTVVEPTTTLPPRPAIAELEGRLLIVVRSDGVVGLDPATGEVVWGASAGGDHLQSIAVGRRVVAVHRDGANTVAFADGEVRRTAAVGIVAVAEGDDLWIFDWTDVDGTWRDLDDRRATPTGDSAVVPTALWSWDLLDPRLRWLPGGGVYRVEGDGLRRVSEGSLAARSTTHLLTRTCDAERRCIHEVVDRLDGGSRPVGSVATEELAIGEPARLSPGGRWLVVERGDELRIAELVDLETDTVQRLHQSADRRIVTFSVDGRFAVVGAGSTVTVREPATGATWSWRERDGVLAAALVEAPD